MVLFTLVGELMYSASNEGLSVFFPSLTCPAGVPSCAEPTPAVTFVDAVAGDAGDAEHEEDDTGADDGDDCIAMLSFGWAGEAFNGTYVRHMDLVSGRGKVLLKCA